MLFKFSLQTRMKKLQKQFFFFSLHSPSVTFFFKILLHFIYSTNPLNLSKNSSCLVQFEKSYSVLKGIRIPLFGNVCSYYLYISVGTVCIVWQLYLSWIKRFLALNCFHDWLLIMLQHRRMRITCEPSCSTRNTCRA